ncbi:hypothetical protein TNCV_4995491 [Trichonephila clavipes]|nr:hypothetical protein TNCV_4995491 [Trichonephila clavipes]
MTIELARQNIKEFSIPHLQGISHPSGIVVSEADCGAVGPGTENSITTLNPDATGVNRNPSLPDLCLSTFIEAHLNWPCENPGLKGQQDGRSPIVLFDPPSSFQ